jgi:hypothetical protein
MTGVTALAVPLLHGPAVHVERDACGKGEHRPRRQEPVWGLLLVVADGK